MKYEPYLDLHFLEGEAPFKSNPEQGAEAWFPQMNEVSQSGSYFLGREKSQIDLNIRAGWDLTGGGLGAV